MHFKNISMKSKLIVLFLTLGLFPLILMSLWTINLSTNALMKKSYNQLEAVREVKKSQLKKFFAERQGDMGGLIDMVAAFRNQSIEKITALQESKKTAVEMFFHKQMEAARLLGSDNMTIHAFSEFVQAFDAENQQTGGAAWKRVENKYSAWMMEYAQTFNYDDLILITPAGDVLYAISQGPEIGQNILQGFLNKSPLAKCFKKSLKEFVIQDFEPYQILKNSQTMFLGVPIVQNHAVLGTVIFRMSSEPIYKLVASRRGLGKTGESYLAGKRGDRSEFRTKMVTMGNGTYVTGKEINTLYVKNALSDKTGCEVFTDSKGELVIAAYTPLKIKGLDWACITKIDMEEAILPKKNNDNGEDDFYSRYVERYEYHDLFLIHPKGRIFYTVASESEYDTNILKGVHKKTGLAQVVRQVLKTHSFGVADFAPYAPSNNEPAAFIAQPLEYDGQVQLIAALQLSLKPINKIMHTREGMGETGETYLVGSDYLMRSDSFLEPVRHSVKASFANPSQGSVKTLAAKEAFEEKSGQKIILDYTGNKVLSAYTPVHFDNLTWALIAEINENEVKKPVKNIINSILIGSLLITIFLVGLALLVAHTITSPLSKSVVLAQEVSKGNLAVHIDIYQKDEIGILVMALVEMVEKLRGIVFNVKQAADNVSQGTSEISAGSNAMSATSEQISQGSAQQAAAVQEASASMEEMASNTRQTADNAKETENLALKSVENARESGLAVQDTLEAMKKIAQKISIIGEISRQTDLLALNAAVEAARAGKQGRGFAVVASEVRKLAEHSQKAANEIDQLSETSVNIAVQAGEKLSLLVPSIEKTSELVQEISAACREQDMGAVQINKAIQQLDTVIQQNVSSAEEMASSAESLAISVEELNQQADNLRKIMGFFNVSTEESPALITSSSNKNMENKPVLDNLLQRHNNNNNKNDKILNCADNSIMDFQQENHKKNKVEDDDFEAY